MANPANHDSTSSPRESLVSANLPCQLSFFSVPPTSPSPPCFIKLSRVNSFQSSGVRIPVSQLSIHVVAFRLLLGSGPTMRRLVPLVLILVAMLQSPSLARKWTSRSGGFSVEAELVDVRDGTAVLKKEDGTEVSVPLSKLSLADVRYIEGVLKSAEAGAGGKVEGMPTPPTETPPAETKQAPAPSGSVPDLHDRCATVGRRTRRSSTASRRNCN